MSCHRQPNRHVVVTTAWGRRVHAVHGQISRFLSQTTAMGSQEDFYLFITFRVSRRPREMYCGHTRLCVYVSVRGRMPTLLYLLNTHSVQHTETDNEHIKHIKQ